MPTVLLTLPPLAEQAERLIEAGAHEIGGVTAAQLRAGAQAYAGRGLLVMHPSRAHVSRLASLIQRDGKRGFVVADMCDADDFAPIEPVALPAGRVYVVVDLDRGDHLAGWSPDEALPAILAAGRTPLTLGEGIHWLITRRDTGPPRRKPRSQAVRLPLCHDAGVPTHVALLRGVNNLGGKRVAMAELREVVTSLGHADVMTYIQSGNVLFTPPEGGGVSGGADAGALAAELEQAIAAVIGVRARAVVLSRQELARCVRDNPYPGQTDPRLLHAVFLPEVPGPSLAAWLADAERQVRAKGSRDQARVRGRAVYLHTPDGYPRSELRRVLAKAGGPTSARVAGTARNWATVNRLLELCGPRPEWHGATGSAAT